MFNETLSRVETIDLIISAEPLNTFFKVVWSEESGNETTNFEEYFNEETLGFFVNTTLAVTIPFRFNLLNLTNGKEQMKLNVTEGYSVETAYEDGNGNGRLDLTLTDDGLTVDSDDRVAYLGLGEAFQTTIVNGRYRSEVFNSSLVFHGLGVSHNQTNVNETQQLFGVETFGYGNVNATPTTDFRWEEPVANADGTVEFDFGVTYNDFPVTWVNLTNPESSVIDNEQIGYDYHIFVDPVSGYARISPTWRYGGIANANLKSAMIGMSLATVVKSEFFAAHAVYSATENNDTVPSSRTERFGILSLRTGAGDSATEIDVTGPKANYTLDNTTYGAAFDAITLVQVAGTFKETTVSPIDSESASAGGTATVGSLVETLTVNFYYQADLIIISYDMWSGGSIVHDPDYAINYEAPEVQTSEPTPTLTPTPTPTPTDTSTTTSTIEPVVSSTPETTQAPSPGLLLPVTLVTFGFAILSRFKKRE